MPTLPPPEGGPPGSPGAARIVYQHESEQVLGGAQLQKVVEVGAVSQPSQVFFQFRLNRTGYTRGVALAYAEGFALLIEGILADPKIAGVAYIQDVNRSGELIDELEVFWTSPDGESEGTVTVNMAAATSDTVAAAVNAAMAPFV